LRTSEDPRQFQRSLREIIDPVLKDPVIIEAGQCDRADYVTNMDEIDEVFIGVVGHTKVNFHQIQTLVSYWRRHPS
jgi:hypothetical protein